MPFPDRSFFEEVYGRRAPWHIGEAQPDLLALMRFRSGSVAGKAMKGGG